jgi:hypothetical protein
MTDAINILPPLIVHDGSSEALNAVKAVLAMCHPSVEVIDLSTAAGRQRIGLINRSLQDGTLNMSVPPLALGDPANMRRALATTDIR